MNHTVSLFWWLSPGIVSSPKRIDAYSPTLETLSTSSNNYIPILEWGIDEEALTGDFNAEMGEIDQQGNVENVEATKNGKTGVLVSDNADPIAVSIARASRTRKWGVVRKLIYQEMFQHPRLHSFYERANMLAHASPSLLVEIHDDNLHRQEWWRRRSEK